MVSFTEAFLLLAREGGGGKDFEHPVYLLVTIYAYSPPNKRGPPSSDFDILCVFAKR